jgi:hypothetical protein
LLTRMSISRTARPSLSRHDRHLSLTQRTYELRIAPQMRADQIRRGEREPRLPVQNEPTGSMMLSTGAPVVSKGLTMPLMGFGP